MKMIFSLSLIGAILLISCIISLLEYSKMTSYVSGVIGGFNICDTVCVSDTSMVGDSLSVITNTITVSPSAQYSPEQLTREFSEEFYRSIIPGIVATGVGILLVAMLLFFILSYYVRPICRMNEELDNFKTYGKRYTFVCDSDDQLSQLSDSISEITNENSQLRLRISRLKNEHQGNQ